MKNLLKRSFALVLAAVILASLCIFPASAETFPSSLYLRQATSVSCTRAANTMMCRALTYLNSNDNWSRITEDDLTNCGAWSDYYGMSWSYTLSKPGDGIQSISVSENAVSGLSLAAVKGMLDAHPEGFVMYCGRLPHAIFITDYVGDTIYCSDPGWGYSGDRRPLTGSYFGTCYGSQANILANVTAYWYVAGYDISSTGSAPVGWLDSVTSEGPGKIRVRGWTMDPDAPAESLTIHVYIGGGAGDSNAEGYAVRADRTREDIATAYPGAGSAHGFDAVLSTGKSGDQPVYVYGLNVGGGSNALLNNSGARVNIPADTEKPVISDVSVSEVSAQGYTVTCKVTDNVGVTQVTMPTWTTSNGQDDLVWHEASVNGDTASFRVSIADHNLEYGDYLTHIYAYDAAGNSAGAAAPVVAVPAIVGDEPAVGTLADGVYTVASALNRNLVLDIDAVSKDAGANLQVWTAVNGAENQLFYIQSLGDGLYTVRALHSSRFLNVAGSGKTNGTNIHQWNQNTPNGDEKWRITHNSDGSYTFIADVNGLAMDVKDGKAANGQNVQCYAPNGTAAQKWVLVPSKVQADFSGPSITDIRVTDISSSGYRVTCTVTDPSGVAGVTMPTWTLKNGQDDLVWHEAAISGSTATFYIKATDHNNEPGDYLTHIYATDGKGYQSSAAAPVVTVPAIVGGTPITGTVPTGVYSVASALNQNYVLDVSAASRDAGANVQVWTAGNQLEQQLWYIQDLGDGTYSVRALHSNRFLNVYDSGKTNGTNIHQWNQNTPNGDEKWRITDNGDGTYTFIAAVNGLAMDVKDGKIANGQNVQCYASNGTAAQKWALIPSSKQADLSGPSITDIRITDVTPNGYRVTCTVTDPAGVASVTMPSWSVSGGQDDLIWHEATVSGDTATCYIRTADHNRETGAYLTHIYAHDTKGNTSSAAAPQIDVPFGAPDGCYRLASAADQSKGLDISGVSQDNGANAHLWTYSGGSNQKFELTYLGDGVYSVMALHSGKYLDVANGSTESGANVQQYTGNGSAAQQWLLKDAGDGYVYVVNQSGLYLDVSGGRTDNGTNVQVWTGNGSTAQKWKLISVDGDSRKGYDAGYTGGMAGTGSILAYGIDLSEHQGANFDFQNLKNSGYSYVILRCGFVSRKDYRFEEYYAAAKAAGLNVGVYFYSYAENAAEAANEAELCLSYIQGKQFEYPVYFDFEDPCAQSYNGALAQEICTAFLSRIEAAGYLPGLYGYAGWMDPNYGAWVPTASICSKWECWMANYYDNTPVNARSANYASTYGMYQYTSSNYVNGVGPLDTNVCYKDYPTIVKTYHFNGY